MRKILIALLVSFFLVSSVFAGYVRGYYRSDGTHVRGYYRTDPNHTVRDNYSYKGNTNPYTGKTGTNYYRDNETSEYYDPYYAPKKQKSYSNSYSDSYSRSSSLSFFDAGSSFDPEKSLEELDDKMVNFYKRYKMKSYYDN